MVGGILKNPAYKGTAAFGKTREVTRRPKLRPQRGNPARPRRTTSTVDIGQEQWLYIPVPALASEALFDAARAQLEENRHALGRANVAPGICCKACWSVLAVSTPTTASRSAIKRPQVTSGGMPTTAVSARTPIDLAANEFVINYRCGPIIWISGSGRRSVRCWKSPNGCSRSMSGI